jgi:hypothetical protein
VRTIVVVLVAFAFLAGCGGGSPRRVSSSAARTAGSSCVRSPGYGGLGARVALFSPNNNGIVGRAGPTPGAAWYQVLDATRGCVLAYSVQESTTPPIRASQMLDLVSRTYLPFDAQRVARDSRCIVWRSKMLKAAVGAPYARAKAAAQSAGYAGHALVETSWDSTCRP